MVHGVPGPTPQTAKREQFARLIAQGTSSAEACRIVGVNPRTGKRWRHGRTITSSSGVQLHYLPVINARKSEISARYLSEDERVRIADLRRAGLTVRRSPPSWTAIRERSAVRCAATVIRPAASTGRSPCSGWRWPVRARPGPSGPGQAAARSGVLRVRPGTVEEAVVSGADQPCPSWRVPRSVRATPEHRDDLPGHLPARAGRPGT